MSKYIITVIIVFTLFSCSKPTPYLVKQIVDSKTIELEDGTTVNLIDVNQPTNKYLGKLKGLVNTYVCLYDENYDPIKDITEGSLNAYVYDAEDNCINELANGEGVNGNLESEGTSQNSQSVISENDTTYERISGQSIEKMAAGNLSELYERNKYSVFLVAVPKSSNSYAQGTGFFITASGIGVSNHHVFAEGLINEAVVKTIDNRQYRIKRIIKDDKKLDFIIFEVENDHLDFPFLTIAEMQPNVGEDVFAIGNPQGLEHTLSKGIISSYREKETMIQTTTEITHGSSGGPLFNMKGKVIGITTSGIGEADLNFAMNIQKLGIKELIK